MSTFQKGDRVIIKDGASYGNGIPLVTVFEPREVNGALATVVDPLPDADGDIYVETFGDLQGVHVFAADLILAATREVPRVREYDTAAADVIASALVEADYGLGVTTAANGGFIVVLEVGDGDRTEAFEVSVRRLVPTNTKEK